jgi:nucleoside-diphosphate-sugar epimerase
MPNTNHPVVLITGGEGFLGQALLRELLKPGADVLRPREIRVFDLRPAAKAAPPGVTRMRGDVRRPDDVRRACAGVDVVFHLAALIDWGQHGSPAVREVNLGGTLNVIDACREAGVGALVSASSLDAIYPGHHVRNADESFPYPARFPNEYCASKAEAEQAVLQANGAPLSGVPGARLQTIVLRPCAIWGEGDPYHIGSFLKLARFGPVFRMGRDRAPYQFVYVGNIAHAFVLAAQALLLGHTETAGQLYFIKDFPPKNLFDQMEPFVRAGGGRILPAALALPHRPVRAIAYLVEAVTRILRPIYLMTPLLTPFSVDSVCSEFTVASDKAERLLGYRPIYTETEARQRTVDFVRSRCM